MSPVKLDLLSLSIQGLTVGLTVQQLQADLMTAYITENENTSVTQAIA
jgi:hypothetical protein